jgi:[ribosomal protein S5]-alanine N-acetyltransferase
MHIIFETERLYIRRYTKADEEDFFRLNSDPDVMRYIREPESKLECNMFLLQNMVAYEQFRLMGRWAMVEKATDAFIGSFAIIPVENEEEIQMGYALLKEYWGRGYAAESVLAGRHYAFEIMKLPRIVALTETGNVGSQKVLLKCGFVQQKSIMDRDKELCLFVSHNPNVIETERLHIFPLTIPQLELYLQANHKLEKLLDLAYTGRTVSPYVKASVTQYTLPKMKAATGMDYLFYTFWLVVEKQSRNIVAELGFKGPPLGAGHVEIGYGTMPAMQKKGYMTEAVGGILKWAAQRPDISHVLAETHSINAASIRVVQKNGFHQYEKRGDMLWWKADVS